MEARIMEEEYEVVDLRAQKVLYHGSLEHCKTVAEQVVNRIKASAPYHPNSLSRRKTKFWLGDGGSLLCGFRQRGYDYWMPFVVIRKKPALEADNNTSQPAV